MESSCEESVQEIYSKWYHKPNNPAKPWGFTVEAAECIHKNVASEVEFQNLITTNEKENCNWPIFESPVEHSLTEEANLSRFLQEILEGDAKYPDSIEARQIFEELDEMVAKMCSSLNSKYKFFHGCYAKRVGSSAECLKTGQPDEFDYNILLPNVAGFTLFQHNWHNSSLNSKINETFFPSLYDRVSTASGVTTDEIYFEIEDLNIFEGIVSQSEMQALLIKEIGRLTNALSAADRLNSSVSGEGSFDENTFVTTGTASKTDMKARYLSAPFMPKPQRLQFEHIFPALEKIIENTLQMHVMPRWSVLPKKTLRNFRSMNQIAITSCLRWQGMEFTNLQINVDFALVIPVNKSPLWYDLPAYLEASDGSNLPKKVSLMDSKETHYYIIKSYNECRLSYGMQEADMFSKQDVNSLPLQCLRICKKLRDMLTTHYFELASESTTPIIPSYWLKTIAMIVFDLKNKIPATKNSSELKDLGNWVLTILTILHNCLSGCQDTHRPCLSDYNVPFKNLFSQMCSGDADDDTPSYLEDDQKELFCLCDSNSTATRDILQVIDILRQFNEDETAARKNFLALKQRINQDTADKYAKGMKEKLGLLLYEYFYMANKDGATAMERQSYMEFINRNFPDIEVVALDNWENIEHAGTYLPVDVVLVENGQKMDLSEMFERAWELRNFRGIKFNRYLREDYNLSHYSI